MSYFLRKYFLLLVLMIFCVTPSPCQAADLDTMIGQMLMAGFRGYTVNDHSAIVRDIRQYHLGGVVLFDYDAERKVYDRNIQNRAQVKQLNADLQSRAQIPLFIAIDQEGGKVQRLKAKYGFTESPSAAQLGKADDATVAQAATDIAHMLNETGFNMDFAPVADVNIDPNSPAIGAIGRSFSSDPHRVAQCDTLFLTQFAKLGIVGCLKHFPGHGSAGADSHKGLTDVTATWSQRELIPYEKLIKQGLPQMIMTAHIFNATLDPDYPATLSKKVITGILRQRLGFNGVVITDDMNMQAISKFYGEKEAIRLAIEAGADILLFGNNLIFDRDIIPKAHAAIHQLVDDGVISVERIRTSYERIIHLKAALPQATQSAGD